MAYKCEPMKTYRDDSVKVMFKGQWRMSVVEAAIMMIPEVDKSRRPFMNPFNNVVEFTLCDLDMTRNQAINAMMDNIACIETYGDFVNSIDAEYWD